MKKILFAVLIVITALGCAPTRYGYSYKLSNPNVPEMTWSDENIGVSFAVTRNSILFEMENLTNETLKLIWDEAVFVQFGKTQKVMHEGVKFIDRNASQPASVIPPRLSIRDAIVPTNNIYWSRGMYNRYASVPGSWQKEDLLPTWTNKDEDQFKKLIESQKGKDAFSVILPIQKGNEIKRYAFTFMVTDVQPR